MIVKVKRLADWSIVSLLSVYSLAAAADLRLVDAAKNQDREAVRSLLQDHADVNAPQGDGATALAWAVHWDDLETAGLLIRAGANVNAANDYGVTPLSLATTNRNAAMVEKVLSAGANPNAALWTGETPLMTAASLGDVAVVKSLLAHGADVNAKETRRGQTALMWAISDQHPEVARLLIEHGADVRAKTHLPGGFKPMVFVAYGADVQATPNGGYTPLLFAARAGDLETVRLLLAKGADVNEGTEEDGSALVMASAGGYEELALFLLEQGADPNAKDSNGMTALHYAMRDGMKVLHGIDIYKALKVCQAGAGARCVANDDAPGAAGAAAAPKPAAAPNAATTPGSANTPSPANAPNPVNTPNPAKTPVASSNAPQGYGGRRPDTILPGSNMLTLAKALLARGADPNAQLSEPPPRLRLRRKPIVSLNGATPFLLAAAVGDLSSMRTLVEGRAKPLVGTVVNDKEFFKEGFGDDNQIQGNATALMLAVGMGRQDDMAREEERKALEAVKILVELGADVNAATETGWTPLHAAAFIGANTLIEFLVEKGASVNVQNGCGQTPVSLAEGSDARGLLQRVTPHDKTAELLRKLGAGKTPPPGPVGRCVEGRFGLEYAVKPATNKETVKEQK